VNLSQLSPEEASVEGGDPEKVSLFLPLITYYGQETGPKSGAKPFL
jgi:hypothetical protein